MNIFYEYELEKNKNISIKNFIFYTFFLKKHVTFVLIDVVLKDFIDIFNLLNIDAFKHTYICTYIHKFVEYLLNISL